MGVHVCVLGWAFMCVRVGVHVCVLTNMNANPNGWAFMCALGLGVHVC